MARKKQSNDDVDLDNDDNIEIEDIEQYELIPPRQASNSARRRRIEELMEERQLHYSIFGDVGW